jgi:hypothetical protein
VINKWWLLLTFWLGFITSSRICWWWVKRKMTHLARIKALMPEGKTIEELICPHCVAGVEHTLEHEGKP